MFDNLIDRHKNEINQILHLAGFVLGIYGLWERDWNYIIAAIIVLIIGHLFPYNKEEEIKTKNKKVRKK